jgi:hypothetical protein
MTSTIRTSNPTLFNFFLIFPQEGDTEAKYGELLIPLEKMKQRIAAAMKTGERTS